MAGTADVTTLGMAVDSSDVPKATDNLNRMTEAAEKTAQAATKMEKEMKKAVAEGTAIGKKIADVINNVIHLGEEFIKLGFEVGHYQDLAEKTQADPAGLASMHVAAVVAGTSVEAISAAINRMTLQLGKSRDESEGAKKALEAIGIETESFLRLRPDEQYKEIAKALDQYADSQKKVQVLQAIFGRGGGDQLVVMKELAKETESQIHLTNEQIRAADDLSDSITRNRAQTKELLAVVSASMIPAWEALLKVINQVVKEMTGFDKATHEFDATRITESAFSLARSLAAVADAANLAASPFVLLGKAIAGVAAVMQAFGDNTANPIERLRRIKSIIGEVREDMAKALSDAATGPSFTDRAEKAIADVRARMAAAAAPPTTGTFARLDREAQINFDPLKDKKAKVDDAAKAYERLMQRVKEFSAQQKEESDIGEKLTAGQKLQIRVNEELDKFGGRISKAKREQINLLLEEAVANEKVNKQREEEKKAMEQRRQEMERLIDQEENYLDQANQLADTEERNSEAFGKTAQQLEMLEVKRLRDLAAAAREKIIYGDLSEDVARLNLVYEQQAAALDRAAKAREERAEKLKQSEESALAGISNAVEKYVQEINKVGSATEQVFGNIFRGIEDAGIQLLRNGKVNTKALVDYMINEFLRLNIVRPLMNDILGSFGQNGSILNQLAGLLIGAFTGAPDTGSGTGDFSRMDRAMGSGAPTGGVTIQQNLTNNIDSRTDRAAVSGEIAEGVRVGNRQLVEELRAHGVI